MTLPKKHNKVQRKQPLFCLEKMYKTVFSGLVTDLTAPGTRERAFGLSKMTRDHRIEPSVSKYGAGGYLFKIWSQLEMFHKRLIFSKDPSFEDISRKSIEEFIEFQHKQRKIDDRARDVVKRAREIVAEILGEFNLHEFSMMCRFGKKAAKGLKRAESYIDLRVEHLEGTQVQLAYFNEIRSHDIHLMRATRKEKKKFFNATSVIHGTTVPKSWKAARIVFPDTTVGGFLSRGLGALLRHRLEASTRIRLAVQQDRHKRWAREASIRGHLATLDMSKASDSFTHDHLEALLPKDWLGIVEAMSTPYYEFPDMHAGKFSSCMLMGSGHTFPLQTILFYACTKATVELVQGNGFVSVYGDDIICPNFAAPAVMWAFELLGFKVNSEKSFFSSDYMHLQKFRESCGGDFYNGLDVRPWMPECETKKVRKTEYIAELHKAINGLTLRWHPTEIEHTLNYLLTELAGVCKISFVPDTETETSGVHEWILQWVVVDITQCNLPTVVNGLKSYLALRPKVKKRLTDGRAPYWDWLAQSRSAPLLDVWLSKDDPGMKLPHESAGGKFRREAKRGLPVRYGWTRKGE